MATFSDHSTWINNADQDTLCVGPFNMAGLVGSQSIDPLITWRDRYDDGQYITLSQEQAADAAKSSNIKGQSKAAEQVYNPKKKWTKLDGVSFLIPENIDDYKEYLGAMLGLEHTQQLTALWFDREVFELLYRFHSFRRSGFCLGVSEATEPKWLWKQIWNAVKDSTLHIDAIKNAQIPFTPKDVLLQSASPNLVMHIALVNTARSLMTKYSAVFHRSNDDKIPKVNGFAADDWACALAVIRAFDRMLTKDPTKMKSVHKNRTCQLVPHDYQHLPGQGIVGRPASRMAIQGGMGIPASGAAAGAVMSGLVEPDLGFDDFNVSVDEADNNRPVPNDEEGVDNTFDVLDAVVTTMESKIPIGKRPLLTEERRRKLITSLFNDGKLVKVLGEDHTHAMQSSVEEQELVAAAVAHRAAQEDEAAESSHSPSMQNAASQDLAQLMKQMDLGSDFLQNDYALTYADACKTLGVDPNRPILDVSSGTVTCRVLLKHWQVTGVAWLMTMKAAGLGAVLGDDCGVGKTLQALAYLAINAQRAVRQYDEYQSKLNAYANQHATHQDGHPGEDGHPNPRPQPPCGDAPKFRPQIICCPANIVDVWWMERKRFFPHALTLKLWHGTPNDAGADRVLQEATIGTKLDDLVTYLRGLDEKDPKTAAVVIVTSYSSATSRALLTLDNRPAIGSGRLRGKRPRTTDEDGEAEIDPEERYQTPLAKCFDICICDEGHHVKNPRTYKHKLVECLSPNQYVFLTATCIPNSAKDYLGYLNLLWKSDWEYDGQLTLNERYGITTSSGSDDGSDGEPSSRMAISERGPWLLDPKVYESFLTAGTMNVTISKAVIPLVWSQSFLRRDMMTRMQIGNGPDDVILIGATIPAYTIETVELGMPKWYKDVHEPYYFRYVGELTSVGPSDNPNEDAQGRININVFKRLSQVALHPDFIELEKQLRTKGGTKVARINEYARREDHGAAFWQQHTQLDESLPLYTSRSELVRYVARKSPKLVYLANYILGKTDKQERVLVYVEWPASQVSHTLGWPS